MTDTETAILCSIDSPSQKSQIIRLMTPQPAAACGHVGRKQIGAQNHIYSVAPVGIVT